MLKNLFNRLRATPAAEPAPAPVAPATPPDDIALADARIDEGNRLEDAGNPAAAEPLYREAVAAAPRHTRAHLNLGILLADKGDRDGATRAYRAVLAIDPAHAFGHYNFARLALMSGNAQEAERLARAALQAKPEFPQAQFVLGNALESLGKPGPAAEAMAAVVRLQPDDVNAWFSLASLLHDLRRLDEAEIALGHVLGRVPGHAAALYLLSQVWRAHGSLPELLEALRAAIRADPDNTFYRTQELLFLSWEEGASARAIFERHVEFGARIERAVPVRFEHAARAAEPGRKLRIGYVSADFCLHPVMFFLLPVLEHHDRAGVETFCYSTRRKVDHITRLARGHAQHWRDAEAMSDEQLADAIHADAIDVLVDLTGYTTVPRPGLFAMRPAPVQAAWVGYLGTTGLTRMGHRLTDARCDPPELAQPLHTERLAFLPESQWCYRPLIPSMVEAPGPLERNGVVTFGSFNDALKLTASMCRRWAEVLVRVPGSRLLIANIGSERRRDAIRRELVAGGVATDRFEFVPRVDLDKYPALVSCVDIAFDTFPYGGGTTTLDALWMGVPVVTAVGETSPSRSAASVLRSLGLDEWVAPTIDDFVDVAVARATDRAAIVALRHSLRPRLEASPLTDAVAFTRALESAYRDMLSGSRP